MGMQINGTVWPYKKTKILRRFGFLGNPVSGRRYFLLVLKMGI
jgi:hypothetical protein